MPDIDTIDARLRAVERTLTGDDHDLTELRTAAELTAEIDALGDRLDAVEERLDRLDAATQAVRGYVGNIRAVNRDVERRADAALAAVETLDDLETEFLVPSYPAPTRPATEECDELDGASRSSETTDRADRTEPGLFARLREAL